MGELFNDGRTHIHDEGDLLGDGVAVGQGVVPRGDGEGERLVGSGVVVEYGVVEGVGECPCAAGIGDGDGVAGANLQADFADAGEGVGAAAAEGECPVAVGVAADDAGFVGGEGNGRCWGSPVYS